MIVGGLRKDGVMTDYELSSVKKVIGTHFKKAAELSCYLREHPELPDQKDGGDPEGSRVRGYIPLRRI